MNAQSMYTNIDIPLALEALQSFFATSPYCPYMHLTLQTAIFFCFGDTFWVQLNGSALGTPVAPKYATIFLLFMSWCISLFQLQLVEYGH
jgi:hypothetical protein